MLDILDYFSFLINAINNLNRCFSMSHWLIYSDKFLEV